MLHNQLWQEKTEAESFSYFCKLRTVKQSCSRQAGRQSQPPGSGSRTDALYGLAGYFKASLWMEDTCGIPPDWHLKHSWHCPSEVQHLQLSGINTLASHALHSWVYSPSSITLSCFESKHTFTHHCWNHVCMNMCYSWFWTYQKKFKFIFHLSHIHTPYFFECTFTYLGKFFPQVSQQWRTSCDAHCSTIRTIRWLTYARI